MQPVRLPLRKIPVALRDKVRVELDNVLKEGVLVAEDGPTDWLSALVVVTKKSGAIRVCIDPKPLNRALKRNNFSLPTLDDILPDLSRAKVFSSVDVKNAFWSMELDEPSSKLTSFLTQSHGKLRWKRLPFGLNVASEEFVRRLLDALAGLKGIACIADDILIYGVGDEISDATKDHDANLLALMQRCREKGIKLNKEKFSFKASELDFMGYTLTPQGLQISKDKVAAIDQMPPPTDLKGVQRLIGMAAFLAKFVPQYSTVIAPIRTLLEKDSEFVWDDSFHGVAFRNLKNLLKSAPVLQFFDERAPIVVQTDASSTGLGGALFQNGKPVAFISRALSKSETMYAQIEKECLSILFGMEKFHTFVYGRRVTVENDHKPLLTIFNKALTSAPRRLQRMMLRLQNYQLDLKHRPGHEMVVPDALSRAYPPKSSSPSPSEHFSEEVAALHDECTSTSLLAASPSTINIIRQAAIHDNAYQLLKRQIMIGWPDSNRDVPIEIKEFHGFCDELTIEDRSYLQR